MKASSTRSGTRSLTGTSSWERTQSFPQDDLKHGHSLQSLILDRRGLVDDDLIIIKDYLEVQRSAGGLRISSEEPICGLQAQLLELHLGAPACQVEGGLGPGGIGLGEIPGGHCGLSLHRGGR